MDKKLILENIKSAASYYKNNLLGKTFLFIFDNRNIEVIFKKKNFLHLTGVATALSAEQFFRDVIKSQLEESQFWFDANHPFALSNKKLIHINDIYQIVSSECFILENINTNSATYEFGATEMNYTLLFLKENLSNVYSVKSLRDGDCFEKATNVFSVTHIFVKNTGEKKYKTSLYCDKNFKLPDSLKNIISDEWNKK